jgi:hypothetical protein
LSSVCHKMADSSLGMSLYTLVDSGEHTQTVIHSTLPHLSKGSLQVAIKLDICSCVKLLYSYPHNSRTAVYLGLSVVYVSAHPIIQMDKIMDEPGGVFSLRHNCTRPEARTSNSNMAAVYCWGWTRLGIATLTEPHTWKIRDLVTRLFNNLVSTLEVIQ